MINIDLPVTDRMLRKMSQMREYNEIDRIISEAKEAVNNQDRTIQDSCIKEDQQRVIEIGENTKSVLIIRNLLNNFSQKKIASVWNI